ncbi:helix-turn-helix domain-containing protein [Streptomyces beijiangensis]|uniref:HTH luxR-type domain-containing protein n=1 Tax=Streptomyces beijiangensis TaxID=163361 RepID=A0A939FEM4_9ACTN|nr:helix-turn-helix transcriptional regulator [Streptomyces beijiangensis]MBO0516578.1 hypothetical protein [Streptomyces beijiangensis]
MAERTGQERDQIMVALTDLRAAGLIVQPPGMTDHWSAVEPATALPALVRTREEEMRRAQLLVTELHGQFLAARESTPAHSPVEHIVGWEEVGRRWVQVLHATDRQLDILDCPPYQAPRGAPVERGLLDRGVRIRIGYDPTDLPSSKLGLVTELQPLGLTARLTPRVPFRLAIADQQLALVSMDTAVPNQRAVVVRPSPLLNGLIMLFDQYWKQGTPLSKNLPELSETERNVLALLGAGLKDEAIARQLGITSRTVRRHVHNLLTLLEANTRFQAAATAAHLNWL